MGNPVDRKGSISLSQIQQQRLDQLRLYQQMEKMVSASKEVMAEEKKTAAEIRDQYTLCQDPVYQMASVISTILPISVSVKDLTEKLKAQPEIRAESLKREHEKKLKNPYNWG